MERLYIKQIEVGPMANFVYLIGDALTREVLIVDPAWQIDTLLKIISENELKLRGVLISHSHYDHCNGIDELLSVYNIPVYINKHEISFLNSIGSGMDLFGSFPKDSVRLVSNMDTLKIGDILISFLHTPGHTPGSQCFIVNNCLVSGDTLFLDGCGRCDLPGGDPEKMYDSLSTKLMQLPSDIIVYPGHFYSKKASDTFQNVRDHNPYFLCRDFFDFKNLIGL